MAFRNSRAFPHTDRPSIRFSGSRRLLSAFCVLPSDYCLLTSHFCLLFRRMKKAAGTRVVPAALFVLFDYHAKWANALLASAMRWTFSFLVTAAPSRLNAGAMKAWSFLSNARQ